MSLWKGCSVDENVAYHYHLSKSSQANDQEALKQNIMGTYFRPMAGYLNQVATGQQYPHVDVSPAGSQNTF